MPSTKAPDQTIKHPVEDPSLCLQGSHIAATALQLAHVVSEILY